MVVVMKIMATSFKSPLHTLLHSVALTLQQATANPHLCQRLLDTHGHVWVSLLWGHCSFLLGPGAHKVLLVPSKSLFKIYPRKDKRRVAAGKVEGKHLEGRKDRWTRL